MRRSFVVLFVLFALAVTQYVVAQSLISGDVQGAITDPSDAVVANVEVVLTSQDTGAAQHVMTNNAGTYRFSLLKPGRYTVTVKHAGFAAVEQKIVVEVGKMATSNVKLAVAGGTETVEVSGEQVNVLTYAPNQTTTFSQQEIAALPNPGSDITNIAQTAPGVVLNNTGGYGNFTVNGLPATSNLFTTNGENNMDPYFNINNTGAVNLTLGSNEVQEASVVTTPYSGEYGQLAGAQVTAVTKSGSNQFHGNALYWWNGKTMNANNWMNNNSGSPQPFSNANQWAGSIGGPIIKNKTFFFFDVEGVRFVLPNVSTMTIPTPAFASAVLANVTAKRPSEASMYQRLFDLYEAAPGLYGAPVTPIAINPDSPCAGGKGGLVLAGWDNSQPCAQNFQATPTALGSEWILAFRIDQNIGNNDKLFGRYKQDRGTQPTTLDFISPAFNAISVQPSWDVQIQETHIFSPNVTNSFTASGSHYVAQFTQNQPLASDTFPYRIISSGFPFSGFTR